MAWAGSKFWKPLATWVVMLLVSVANGAVRDLTYGKHMGELAGHQLSTIFSVLLLGWVIRAYVRCCPPASSRHAMAIGLLWMLLTVLFEFGFFHFIGGHSWAELLANYNLLQGRVWIVVVLWVAIAPFIFFHFSRRT